ncbi:Formylglycine-generating enzyme, required for sulfatase activity, contains SUMF1/FGE domain [Spirosomataceae bacterium TFI 002]|nr:Formylglycine-generating enzyme, required for sulfatase activity, contains SUMF1/FGE domain [Spirosomataceae bacterium TFI 002]
MKLTVFSILSLLFFSLSSDDFESYQEKISNTDQVIDMIAINGGTFKMGSPEQEKGREENEGPQKKVEVSPFWMAKYETTWDLYLIYTNKDLEIDANLTLDAIARPTPPYVEMSFGQGKKGGFPVCNVTQYSARSFCKWLYEKTGHFYRLPTEAEWEYAARAGSKTAFSFGDNIASLGEYAVYFDNSNGAYKKTGSLKPNAWGLHDMHGNVAEWTSDQFLEDYFTKIKDGQKDPFFSSNVIYPHTIKGGHWDDDPEFLRSASRVGSTPKLKQRDPQIPKSDWWMTNAPFLGFRVVRPLNEPSKEEIERYFSKPPKDM